MARGGVGGHPAIKDGGFQVLVAFGLQGVSFPNLSVLPSDGVLPGEGESVHLVSHR